MTTTTTTTTGVAPMQPRGEQLGGQSMGEEHVPPAEELDEVHALLDLLWAGDREQVAGDRLRAFVERAVGAEVFRALAKVPR